MLLHPRESTDPFEVYKAPYLISTCISLLPPETTVDLLKDESVLADLFSLLSTFRHSVE